MTLTESQFALAALAAQLRSLVRKRSRWLRLLRTNCQELRELLDRDRRADEHYRLAVDVAET